MLIHEFLLLEVDKSLSKSKNNKEYFQPNPKYCLTIPKTY